MPGKKAIFSGCFVQLFTDRGLLHMPYSTPYPFAAVSLIPRIQNEYIDPNLHFDVEVFVLNCL